MGELGDFEIEVRRPTFEEATDDSETIKGFVATRLKRHLVGWRGVEDNGEPLPFTWEAFEGLCLAAPVVLTQANDIINGYFVGITVEQEKNSESPSGES